MQIMHNLNWLNGTVLELAMHLIPAKSPKKAELVRHLDGLLDLSATGKIVASAARYRRLIAVYTFLLIIHDFVFVFAFTANQKV
jgi:hypothetical protein